MKTTKTATMPKYLGDLIKADVDLSTGWKIRSSEEDTLLTVERGYGRYASRLGDQALLPTVWTTAALRKRLDQWMAASSELPFGRWHTARAEYDNHQAVYAWWAGLRGQPKPKATRVLRGEGETAGWVSDGHVLLGPEETSRRPDIARWRGDVEPLRTTHLNCVEKQFAHELCEYVPFAYTADESSWSVIYAPKGQELVSLGRIYLNPTLARLRPQDVVLGERTTEASYKPVRLADKQVYLMSMRPGGGRPRPFSDCTPQVLGGEP